jgi:hypothetical protein
MRLCIIASTLLIVLTGSVSAEPPLDELTPCSAAIRVFASNDEMHVREVTKFIDQVFEQLDQEHTKFGEPSILQSAQFTRVLEMMVGGLCQQHQASTIYIEAAKVYRDTRARRVHADFEP